MPRTRKVPFAPWQTLKNDGIEERYIRLGNSQLQHPAIRALHPNAFKVYVYMLLESGGKLTFKFPRRVYLKYVSKGGFEKSKDELITAGFIEVEENNANLRKANKYRFSEAWKDFQP